MGLGSSHLLKAVPQRRHAKCEGPESRLLPYNSVSTHALIALALRWSCAAGKAFGMISNSGARDKLSSFLDTWVRTHTPPLSSDIILYLGGDASWPEYAPPLGSDAVTVKMTDGSLDLSPLHSAMAQLKVRSPGHWLVGSLRSFKSVASVHIMDFMRHLCSNNVQPLLKQLVWFLGSFLDFHMAILSWPTTHKTLCYADKGFQAKHIEDVALVSSRGQKRTHTVMQDSWRVRDERLYKYWMKGREHFQGWTQLSIAFDFSRVGGRATGVMLACTADNVAHWMPPQDML